MDKDNPFEAVMSEMFMQAHAQFGDAIKAYWFYDEDGCPGCGREVKVADFEGKPAVSLNAYIYRKRGILIGYMLCNRCVKSIFRSAKRRSGKKTDLHTLIESNLADAFEKHIH
ncbi:MAG TPA: hypothetical protein ENJ56_00925 [Anaerolineae bacterium]|nr:hypothetical protein [Anaerolineae bacterium]